MTIQEILEAHTQSFDWYPCKCGWKPTWDGRGAGEGQHRAHVAEVLDKHMQEREAEAKAEALNEAAGAYPVMLRDMVSRGSVEAWLRARANQHKEGADNGR